MVYANTDIVMRVTANVVEQAGYRSLICERPRGFAYEAGDWIDIQFNGRQLSGGATYSLSSSPTEPVVMITFKDGFSEMKRALAESRNGDTLRITQYGNDYGFSLKQHKTSTLLAGGVGIAPCRSMIKQMADTADRNSVSLIYLHKTADFLFKADLDRWQAQLSGLSITYIVTEGLNKKDKHKAILGAIHTHDGSFYIAGPEGMVEATEHLLIDNGVAVRDIRIDSFGGY